MKLDLMKLVVVILTTGIIFAQTYNGPESAVYDQTGDGRWLASNWGNGDIIARANDGTLTYFNQGTSIASLGMVIVGNTLYVAGQKSDLSYALFGFDLTTGAVINTTIINGFTSDVTADAAGNIYVSDMDKIYQVDPLAQTYTTIYTNTGGLNGVLFDDTNNRLLFTVNTAASQIWALDMSTMIATVLITNSFGGLDGLTVDHNGNYYVSSYFTNEIYRYDSNFTNSVLAAVVPDGVADIYFASGAPGKVKDAKDINSTFGVLAVPNLVDKVNFIPFDQLDAEDSELSVPSEFRLHQNFPNPFNPSTSISYEIMGESLVNITVYDLLGAEVVQLVNEIQQPGIKTTNWNGKDSEGNMVNGGIYVYRLNTNNYSETKKMVLLK